MKILIATGIYPPEVGGPAIYAKEIHDELESRNIEAPVFHYGKLEKSLPPGLRHLAYAFRLLPHVWHTDAVLAFDTGSTGLPAAILARLFRKKFLVRIGGDFLWESYVERTGDLVRLSEFYNAKRPLTLKERLIFKGTKFLLKHSFGTLFTTSWQRDIWRKAYGFKDERAFIIDNFYPPREKGDTPDKSFLFVGRVIKLKNEKKFLSAFETVRMRHPDIFLDGLGARLSREGYLERVRRCYAVVLPSVSDVNPNMIIDAVKYGKPFLCTRDSGIHERLKGIGVFVDTLDETELVRGLETLLDPVSYRDLQRNIEAFPYVHTWAQITDEIVASVRRP